MMDRVDGLLSVNDDLADKSFDLSQFDNHLFLNLKHRLREKRLDNDDETKIGVQH